jgi:hypothetical protein
MESNRKFADSTWYLPALPATARRQSQPVSLGALIKKMLKITEWSDLLAEGDEPYFGF